MRNIKYTVEFSIWTVTETDIEKMEAFMKQWKLLTIQHKQVKLLPVPAEEVCLCPKAGPIADSSKIPTDCGYTSLAFIVINFQANYK